MTTIDDTTDFRFNIKQLAAALVVLAGAVFAYARLESRTDRNEEKISDVHSAVKDVAGELKAFREEWKPAVPGAKP